MSNTTQTTRQIGVFYEQQALMFLQAEGCQPIVTNFIAPKMGEIDIIALHGQCLIFVEVKYRKSATHGSATAYVGLAKQRRIVRTAQYFLACHDEFGRYDCRFDVVAFDDEQAPVWLQGAFLAE